MLFRSLSVASPIKVSFMSVTALVRLNLVVGIMRLGVAEEGAREEGVGVGG